MKMVYEYDDGREAAFDIHTSWVTPDNFPGYVEQEVQFRFDNGLWNGHSRKRGVEATVEDLTPFKMKNSINNHYNGEFLEPWGQRSHSEVTEIEVIERYAREVAYLEHGGPKADRPISFEANSEPYPTTTCQQIVRQWPLSKHWRPSWKKPLPVNPTALFASIANMAAWCLIGPAQPTTKSCTKDTV